LLQQGDYTIGKKDEARVIKPSDIGILVRTGWQGRNIKTALGQLGIPSVTIDDDKVLQSPEADALLYLLQAIADPDRSSINRALLSSFTGMNTAAILALDDEVALKLFTDYKERWSKDGVYTALLDFAADFGIRQSLLRGHTESGERIVTNFFQLAELLHQAESRKGFSMTELISWLRRGIDGMLMEGDEYLQRVESDEDAVKIITIHKSKGLEYKIVFAPFLDFTANDRHSFLSLRDPETGDYIGAEKARLSEEQLAWHAQQEEQENRRLLYVAITRAVYKCYIFRNRKEEATSLSVFTDALQGNPPPAALIRFEEMLPVPPAERYRAAQTTMAVNAQPVSFHLMEENWRRMSYTMLAGKHEAAPRVRAFPQGDPYDTFMSLTLPRGAGTGNFLHYLFEKVHFDNDAKWE
ncbi:MAG: hypothetical protein JST39_05110, partial [Bacteroidetes bacterium]|nr:hypothetical protein [Bacteroidota bacterium]